MCRATSVANASSEFRRAYSRSRSMSSVGILPIHLRRREKVTDFFYGRLTGALLSLLPLLRCGRRGLGRGGSIARCVSASSFPDPPPLVARAQFASAFVFICVHLRLSAVFFSGQARRRFLWLPSGM